MTKATYTEMVDSGIEWIGKTPKEWEVRKNKRLYGKHFWWIWWDDALNNEDDTPCIRVADFDYEKLSTIENIETIRNISSEQKQSKILKKWDIILEKSWWWEKTPVWRAVLFDKEVDMVCANFNEVLRPKKDLSSKFLIYLHNYLYLSKVNLRSIKQNTWIQNLDIYWYLSDLVPLPPLTTQQSIASYLDDKTAQIEQSISLKTQQIELMKEKRTALINHIVTKWLDPDIELVESGIEWIGKIPKEWEVLPFRRKCQLKQWLQIPQEVRLHEQTNNSLEYITIKSIHNPDNPKEYIENPSSWVICDVDDILFARTWATWEVITWVHWVFHNNFFKVSYDKNSIDKSYLVRYLQFEPLKKRLLLLAWTTTIPDLNHGSFLSSPLILPSSKQEQEFIVSYLDTETAQIDNTIALVQQSIDLLVEYKQSLISHVVTGKVKVG